MPESTGDSVASRAIFHMKDLFFQYNPDIDAYSEVDTRGECKLSWIIGDFLAASIRVKECPIELLRMRMDAYIIVVRRRFSDIKVELYERE